MHLLMFQLRFIMMTALPLQVDLACAKNWHVIAAFPIMKFNTLPDIINLAKFYLPVISIVDYKLIESSIFISQ